VALSYTIGTTSKRESATTRSYAQLQKQLHQDVWAENPDWVDAQGNSPMCDWYDRGLAKLISTVNAIRGLLSQEWQCVDSPHRPLLKPTYDPSLANRRTNQRWAARSLTHAADEFRWSEADWSQWRPRWKRKARYPGIFPRVCELPHRHAGLTAQLRGRNRIASSQSTYHQFEVVRDRYEAFLPLITHASAWRVSASKRGDQCLCERVGRTVSAISRGYVAGFCRTSSTLCSSSAAAATSSRLRLRRGRPSSSIVVKRIDDVGLATFLLTKSGPTHAAPVATQMFRYIDRASFRIRFRYMENESLHERPLA